MTYTGKIIKNPFGQFVQANPTQSGASLFEPLYPIKSFIPDELQTPIEVTYYEKSINQNEEQVDVEKSFELPLYLLNQTEFKSPSGQSLDYSKVGIKFGTDFYSLSDLRSQPKFLKTYQEQQNILNSSESDKAKRLQAQSFLDNLAIKKLYEQATNPNSFNNKYKINEGEALIGDVVVETDGDVREISDYWAWDSLSDVFFIGPTTLSKNAKVPLKTALDLTFGDPNELNKIARQLIEQGENAELRVNAKYTDDFEKLQGSNVLTAKRGEDGLISYDNNFRSFALGTETDDVYSYLSKKIYAENVKPFSDVLEIKEDTGEVFRKSENTLDNVLGVVRDIDRSAFQSVDNNIQKQMPFDSATSALSYSLSTPTRTFLSGYLGIQNEINYLLESNKEWIDTKGKESINPIIQFAFRNTDKIKYKTQDELEQERDKFREKTLEIWATKDSPMASFATSYSDFTGLDQDTSFGRTLKAGYQITAEAFNFVNQTMLGGTVLKGTNTTKTAGKVFSRKNIIDRALKGFQYGSLYTFGTQSTATPSTQEKLVNFGANVITAAIGENIEAGLGALARKSLRYGPAKNFLKNNTTFVDKPWFNQLIVENIDDFNGNLFDLSVLNALTANKLNVPLTGTKAFLSGIKGVANRGLLTGFQVTRSAFTEYLSDIVAGTMVYTFASLPEALEQKGDKTRTEVINEQLVKNFQNQASLENLASNIVFAFGLNSQQMFTPVSEVRKQVISEIFKDSTAEININTNNPEDIADFIIENLPSQGRALKTDVNFTSEDLFSYQDQIKTYEITNGQKKRLAKTITKQISNAIKNSQYLNGVNIQIKAYPLKFLDPQKKSILDILINDPNGEARAFQINFNDAVTQAEIASKAIFVTNSEQGFDSKTEDQVFSETITDVIKKGEFGVSSITEFTQSQIVKNKPQIFEENPTDIEFREYELFNTGTKELQEYYFFSEIDSGDIYSDLGRPLSKEKIGENYKIIPQKDWFLRRFMPDVNAIVRSQEPFLQLVIKKSFKENPVGFIKNFEQYLSDVGASINEINIPQEEIDNLNKPVSPEARLIQIGSKIHTKLQELKIETPKTEDIGRAFWANYNLSVLADVLAAKRDSEVVNGDIRLMQEAFVRYQEFQNQQSVALDEVYLQEAEEAGITSQSSSDLLEEINETSLLVYELGEQEVNKVIKELESNLDQIENDNQIVIDEPNQIQTEPGRLSSQENAETSDISVDGASEDIKTEDKGVDTSKEANPERKAVRAVRKNKKKISDSLSKIINEVDILNLMEKVYVRGENLSEIEEETDELIEEYKEDLFNLVKTELYADEYEGWRGIKTQIRIVNAIQRAQNLRRGGRLTLDNINFFTGKDGNLYARRGTKKNGPNLGDYVSEELIPKTDFSVTLENYIENVNRYKKAQREKIDLIKNIAYYADDDFRQKYDKEILKPAKKLPAEDRADFQIPSKSEIFTTINKESPGIEKTNNGAKLLEQVFEEGEGFDPRTINGLIQVINDPDLKTDAVFSGLDDLNLKEKLETIVERITPKAEEELDLQGAESRIIDLAQSTFEKPFTPYEKNQLYNGLLNFVKSSKGSESISEEGFLDTLSADEAQELEEKDVTPPSEWYNNGKTTNLLDEYGQILKDNATKKLAMKKMRAGNIEGARVKFEKDSSGKVLSSAVQNIPVIERPVNYNEYLQEGNLDYQKPIENEQETNAFLKAKVFQIQKNPLNEAQNLGELLTKPIDKFTNEDYQKVFDTVEDKEFWNKIEPIQSLVENKINRNRLSEIYLKTELANSITPPKDPDISSVQQASIFAPLVFGNLSAPAVLAVEQLGLTTTVQSYGNSINASIKKEWAQAKANYQIYQVKETAQEYAKELYFRDWAFRRKFNTQDFKDIWELLSFSDVNQNEVVFFEVLDRDTNKKRPIMDILQQGQLEKFISQRPQQRDVDIENILKVDKGIFRQVIREIDNNILMDNNFQINPLVRDIEYKDGMYKSTFSRKSSDSQDILDDDIAIQNEVIQKFIQKIERLETKFNQQKRSAGREPSIYSDLVNILDKIKSDTKPVQNVQVKYKSKILIPREPMLAKRVKNKFQKNEYRPEILEMVKKIRGFFNRTANILIQEGILQYEQEAYVPGFSSKKFKNPIIEQVNKVSTGVDLEIGAETKTITTLRDLLYVEQNNTEIFGEINYQELPDWLLEEYAENARRRLEKNNLIKKLVDSKDIISEKLMREKERARDEVQRKLSQNEDPETRKQLEAIDSFIGLVKSRTEKKAITETTQELKRVVEDLKKERSKSRLRKEKKALSEQIKATEQKIKELNNPPLYNSFFDFNGARYYVPASLHEYLFYANIVNSRPSTIDNEKSLQKWALDLEASTRDKQNTRLWIETINRTGSLLYTGIISNFTSSATNLVQGGLLGLDTLSHILFDSTIKPIVNLSLGKKGSFNYAKAINSLTDQKINSTINELFLPEASYRLLKEFFDSNERVFKTNSNTWLGKALNNYNSFLSDPTVYFVHKGLVGATFGSVTKYINFLTKIQVMARLNELLEEAGYTEGIKSKIDFDTLLGYFSEARNFVNIYQTLPGTQSSIPSLYLGASKKFEIFKMFLPFTGWIAQQIGATASSARFVLDSYKKGVKTKQQKADFVEANYDLFVKSALTIGATTFLMEMIIALLAGALGGEKEELPEGKPTNRQAQNLGFALDPIVFTFNNRSSVVFDTAKFQNDSTYFRSYIIESLLDDIGWIDSELSTEQKMAAYQIIPLPAEITRQILSTIDPVEYGRFDYSGSGLLTSVASAFPRSLGGAFTDFARDLAYVTYTEDGKDYRAELRATNALQQLLGPEFSLTIADNSGLEIFRPEIREFQAGEDEQGKVIKKPKFSDWQSRLAKSLPGASGVVNLNSYKAQIQEDIVLYQKQRGELIQKLETGEITAEEYNEELEKLEYKKDRLGF